MSDTTNEELALQLAVSAVKEGWDQRQVEEVLRIAKQFYYFLAPIPAKLVVFPTGEVTDLNTGKPTGTPITQGGTMQLHDNEEFTLSVSETDSKGVALQDTLTWSENSNGQVVTLQVAADTQSAVIVANLPGSAVVTVTDGTLSATEAVDVVPGTVAKINISEGAVSTQAPTGGTTTPPASA